MDKFIEDLEAYFNKPKEQIQSDLDKTEHIDRIGFPLANAVMATLEDILKERTALIVTTENTNIDALKHVSDKDIKVCIIGHTGDALQVAKLIAKHNTSAKILIVDDTQPKIHTDPLLTNTNNEFIITNIKRFDYTYVDKDVLTNKLPCDFKGSKFKKYKHE